MEITLDEKNVDGEDADGNDNSSLDRDKANKYHLLPGKTYEKDPTIHVKAGSEECYLFVKVVNGLEAIEANDAGNDTIAEQMKNVNGWVEVAGETDVYVYESTVDARTAAQDKVIFNNFKLATDANVSAYASATITVQAFAIQADGFADVDAAWDAIPDAWKN